MAEIAQASPIKITVDGKPEETVATWTEMQALLSLLRTQRPGSEVRAFDRCGKRVDGTPAPLVAAGSSALAHSTPNRPAAAG